MDVFPALHFLENTKVSENGGRTSGDTRRAEDKDFVVLVFEDVLDHLSSLKKLVVVVRVSVIDIAFLTNVDTILLI